LRDVCSTIRSTETGTIALEQPRLGAGPHRRAARSAEAGERPLALASTTHLRSFANGTLGAVYALRGRAIVPCAIWMTRDALESGAAVFQRRGNY